MTKKTSNKLEFTDKQKRFLAHGNRRYNIKSGATGSGKTYLDYFNLYRRIKQLSGKKGGFYLLGATKGSLQRNIIEPMQEIYGVSKVSNISSNNTVMMFGEKVHALGAGNSLSINKIRGVTAKYIYGDEVATWHPEMFGMVKTRLRTPYSIFDGTCNPEDEEHWFKVFIDEMRRDNPDSIFYQKYNLWDGRLSNDPEEDSRMKAQIASEFSGVEYDRYILGKWVNAEGLVYDEFGRTYKASLIEPEQVPRLDEVIIGVDFGNNASKHAFVATGFSNNYREMYVIASKVLDTTITSNQLADAYVDFLLFVEKFYGVVVLNTYADSAQQTHLKDMRASLYNRGLSRSVNNSRKGKIVDRINVFKRMYNLGAVKIVDSEAYDVVRALKSALWDPKRDMVRIETVGTDVLDAFEYSYSSRMNRMIK